MEQKTQICLFLIFWIHDIFGAKMICTCSFWQNSSSMYPCLATPVILAFRGSVVDLFVARKYWKRIILTTLDHTNSITPCIFIYRYVYIRFFLLSPNGIYGVNIRWGSWLTVFPHVPLRSHDIQRDQFLLPYYLWLLSWTPSDDCELPQVHFSEKGLHGIHFGIHYTCHDLWGCFNDFSPFGTILPDVFGEFF